MKYIYTLVKISRGFEDLIGTYSSSLKCKKKAFDYARYNYLTYPMRIIKDYDFKIYKTTIKITTEEFTYCEDELKS